MRAGGYLSGTRLDQSLDHSQLVVLAAELAPHARGTAGCSLNKCHCPESARRRAPQDRGSRQVYPSTCHSRLHRGIVLYGSKQVRRQDACFHERARM